MKYFLLILSTIYPSLLFSQQNNTPKSLLKEIARIIKANQYDKLNDYMLPTQKNSLSEIECFIDCLKTEQEIRIYLKLGYNKFQNEFIGAMDKNIFIMLYYFASKDYEQAAEKGVATLHEYTAIIEFEFSIFPDDLPENLKLKNSFTLIKEDSLWYIPVQGDRTRILDKKKLDRVQQYINNAKKILSQCSDSKTFAEKLLEIEYILK